MIVGRWKLPKLFVEMCESDKFSRETGSWDLINDIDAYGNPLETDLGTVYATKGEIIDESAMLPQHFRSDGYYGTPTPDEQTLPGYISDILDFSGIVCFGTAGSGEQFCLDYRDDSGSPSVIMWDDNYWRRISPDFESFVKLFTFTETL
jgi:hypothetical protein